VLSGGEGVPRRDLVLVRDRQAGITEPVPYQLQFRLGTVTEPITTELSPALVCLEAPASVA
jgi:hypothetical protein